MSEIKILSIACPKCHRPCVVKQLEYEPTLASWSCFDCDLMGTAKAVVVEETE